MRPARAQRPLHRCSGRRTVGCPEAVLAGIYRIREPQMTTNMCINARDAMPKGGEVPGPGVDPLKYQTPAAATARGAAPAAANRDASTSNEMLTLKIRYKEPTGTESKLLSFPLTDRGGQFARATQDFRFAASVAEFGMILRDSSYRGKASISDVLDNAQGSKGADRNGYRQEFINLVSRARTIRGIE